MSGVKALRKIQLGAETTAGTAVAATAIWRGTGVIADDQEMVFAEEDVGLLSGTDRSYVPRLGATITFDSVPATFEQLPYILDAGIAKATTAAEGSGYLYSYAMPRTSQNTPQTYTIEAGDNQAAEELEYAFVESFTLSGEGGGPVQVSAEWRGRRVSTSAFTTAGIGLDPVEEILFSKGKLYIDDNTVGATLVSATLLGMDMPVNTGFVPRYTADGELYFTAINQVMPEVTVALTFEHNASAVAEKAKWRAQTRRHIRLQFDGSALATAGTSYSTKALRINLAGKWETFEALSDEDGNDTVTGTFRARSEESGADDEFCSIYVVNDLSALP